MSRNPEIPKRAQSKLPFVFDYANTMGDWLNKLGWKYPELDADILERKAIKSTGLEDFGNFYYRKGLEVLLEAGQNDGLNFLGKIELRQIALECLMNRLLWVDGVKTYGRDFGVTLHPPIVITGLYRTGTTLLHRMLSSTQSLQGLPAWLLIKPFPLKTYRSDNRRKYIEGQLRLFHAMRPKLKLKHDVDAQSPEECSMGQGFTFMSHFFADSLPVKSYMEWYDHTDRSLMYAEYASLLHWYQSLDQKCMVLKSPSHTGDLKELLNSIGPAKVIQLHRDPVDAVCSALSLFHTDQTLYMKPYNLQAFVDSIVSMLKELAMRNIEFRLSYPNQEILDLQYTDLFHDPVGTSMSVLKYCGIQPTEDDYKAMVKYYTEHPYAKHGKHEYSPEEFGLTADEIRVMFREYSAIANTIAP